MNNVFSASNYKTITASDTAKITDPSGKIARCRGVYIGGAGNLAVKDELGNAVTFISLAIGVIHPISTDQIMSTNTTATNIIALF